MNEIKLVNLFELLGTVPTASDEEIETAYRIKALSCDPDKNPDNPKAAELFRELKNARMTLTTKHLRESYDRYWNKTLGYMARLRDFIAQRESMEREFQEAAEKREKWEKSIDRQLEAHRLMNERMQLIDIESREESLGIRTINVKNAIFIKWNAAENDSENGGYNYENLYRTLSKYGEIKVSMMLSGGRAMVEYENRSDAVMATQIEKGFFENPLSLQGLWEINGKK